MTNEEIAALRALAVAVPEYRGGVWYAPPGRPEDMWHTVYERNGDRVIADATDAPTAAYIAAANPAAVLSLLDRLARVEAERDRMRETAEKLTNAIYRDHQRGETFSASVSIAVDGVQQIFAALEPRA